MHQPRRWGGRGSRGGRGGRGVWFLLASLCTLSAHGALTTCLGSGSIAPLCPPIGANPSLQALPPPPLPPAAACCPLPAHCLHLAGCPDQGPLPDITTLYRRIAAWSDFTEPLAVLRLGRPAGALHFLPPPRGQAEAAGGLLAVGDDAGTLHLLSLDGRVVAQHHTGGWIAGAGMP